MESSKLSVMLAVIVICICITCCYGKPGVRQYRMVSYMGHNAAETETFDSLDSAAAAWNKKCVHTKILYFTVDGRNCVLVMCFSACGRLGELMGATCFHPSDAYIGWKPNKFERGYACKDFLFSSLWAVASYNQHKPTGVRIKAIRLGDVSKTFAQLTDPVKMIVHWRRYKKTHDYVEFFVHKKHGDENLCTKIEHILKAVDYGQLYSQALCTFSLGWIDKSSRFQCVDIDEKPLVDKVWDELPDPCTKLLLNRVDGWIFEDYCQGEKKELFRCHKALQTLNMVFPMGTWGASAKNARTWWDVEKKTYVMEAELGHGDKLVTNDRVGFDHRKNYYQYDGRLTPGDG